MVFTLRRNPIDLDMIEFYTKIGGCECLACVMHEDCLSESNLFGMIEGRRSIKVSLEVVNEQD